MKVIGTDPGKAGGISDGTTHISMPTRQVVTKPAVMILAKDSNGKKQYYKSGPNVGQPKYKIKTPAKYALELDVFAIRDMFQDSDVIVIEAQGTSFGNSAKSTRTTSMNFGKLLAIAELSGAKVVTVAPHKWKADLGLTDDKEACVELAETLSGTSFRTSRGALQDGPAEAYLIRHWYLRQENT
jgi:hypothetical protein